MGLKVYINKEKRDIDLDNSSVLVGVQVAYNDKCLGFQHPISSFSTIKSIKAVKVSHIDLSEISSTDLANDFIKFENNNFVVNYQQPYGFNLDNSIYKIVFKTDIQTYETEYFLNISRVRYVSV